MQRMTLGAVVGALAVGIIVIALVASLMVANQTIPNTGNVNAVGVQVWWDKECTSRVLFIDWQSMNAGDSKTCTIYVKNNGTAAGVMGLAASGWDPAPASGYISLDWNCTDYVMAHEEVVAAVLTLSVSPSITGITGFSFDITVSGTETT